MEFFVTFYGIIPSNPLASLAMTRQTRNHGDSFSGKYWEIIANRLSKAGWSWGYVSAVSGEGRRIWIADAHGSSHINFQMFSISSLS